jgi:energy-coupling factor transporter ATP-binding protein EcfA2
VRFVPNRVTTLIDARGLAKAFDARAVLSDVDIAVAQGEIVTLIGPNGAGKTVLLRILLGLEAADAGTVDRKPDLTVGYMPQKIEIDANLPLSVGRFVRRSKPCRAANSSVRCWRGRSCASRSFWCSTNRPKASTRRAKTRSTICWRTWWRGTAAACCW